CDPRGGPPDRGGRADCAGCRDPHLVRTRCVWNVFDARPGWRAASPGHVLDTARASQGRPVHPLLFTFQKCAPGARYLNQGEDMTFLRNVWYVAGWADEVVQNQMLA